MTPIKRLQCIYTRIRICDEKHTKSDMISTSANCKLPLKGHLTDSKLQKSDNRHLKQPIKAQKVPFMKSQTANCKLQTANLIMIS